MTSSDKVSLTHSRHLDMKDERALVSCQRSQNRWRGRLFEPRLDCAFSVLLGSPQHMLLPLIHHPMSICCIFSLVLEMFTSNPHSNPPLQQVNFTYKWEGWGTRRISNWPHLTLLIDAKGRPCSANLNISRPFPGSLLLQILHKKSTHLLFCRL